MKLKWKKKEKDFRNQNLFLFYLVYARKYVSEKNVHGKIGIENENSFHA